MKIDLIEKLLGGKRYTEYKIKGKKKYIFDRFIFNVALLMILVSLFLIAYSQDFNLNYFSCNTDLPDQWIPLSSDYCENPFYRAPDWTNQITLPPGEYGVNPSTWLNFTLCTTFGILISAFGVNHLLYNRVGR